MAHERVPELTLPPANAIQPQVCGVEDSQSNRTSRLIAIVAILVIPGLAITIEIANAVTFERDVGAAEQEGSGKTGVCDRVGVAEPVRDVVTPL